jgi:hypothetical protein
MEMVTKEEMKEKERSQSNQCPNHLRREKVLNRIAEMRDRDEREREKDGEREERDGSSESDRMGLRDE